MQREFVALCLLLPLAAAASVTGLDNAAANMVDLHGEERRGESVPVMRLGGQVGNGAEIRATLTDGSVGESAQDAKLSGAASSSAKLEKASHKLMREDLKLKQDVDAAKAKVANTKAVRSQAVKKQQQLAEAEKKEAGTVLKAEEKNAGKAESAATLRNDVKALTKDKKEQGAEVSAAEDAKIAAQNAKLTLKKERLKMLGIEEKEKVVKRRLNKSLKKASRVADKSINSDANAQEVKKVMKTKIAAIKDDFQERHKRDVRTMQKERAKATAAMQQSAMLKKNLESMKTAIGSLKTQVETAAKGASKDAASAKSGYKAEVKKLTAEEAAERIKEKTLRQEKNTLSATVHEAKKTLDAKNAKIAAEKIDMAKLKGELKVAQNKARDAEVYAAEKLKNSEKSTKRQRKLVAQEKTRAERRKQKIDSMKAENFRAKVTKAELQKLEKARRKELTAIKVATKEQNARLQAQADDKAEKKAELKMQKKLAIAQKEAAVETAKAKAATKSYSKELKNEAKLGAKEKQIEAKDTAAIAALKKRNDAMKQHVTKVKELGVKAVNKAVIGEQKKAARVENKIVKAARSSTDKKVADAEAKQLQKMDKKDGSLMEQLMQLKTQMAEMKTKHEVDKTKLKRKWKKEKKKRGKLEVETIKLKGAVREAGACTKFKDEISATKARLARQGLRDRSKIANAGALALAKSPAPVCKCPVCKSGSESDDVGAKLKALQKAHDDIKAAHTCCKDDLKKAELKKKDISRQCAVTKSSLKKEIDRLRGAKDSASKKAVKEAGKAELANQKAKDENVIVKDEKAQIDAMGGGDKNRLILRKVRDIEKKLKGGKDGKGGPGGGGQFTPAAELKTCQGKLSAAESKVSKIKVRASGAANELQSTKTLVAKVKKERDLCNSKLMKGFTQEPKKPENVPGPQGPSGVPPVGGEGAGHVSALADDDSTGEDWDAP